MIEIVVQNAGQNRPDRSVNLNGVKVTDLMGSTVHELLAQVLARYGSIDVFIARLHVLLDTPTVERPAAVAPSAGGRHRLAEPTGTVPMTTAAPPRPHG
ncbi:hypothetical protein ACFXG4_48085 [Nocardia sp. NPDC059246]|uniref:hypothetical protein n=1 Tax=unclassified Nocardia TaxID=2637762 RepID=UPI00367D62DA